MKRTKRTHGKADLILTADWHLRDDTPVCRTDDFIETQVNKMKQVSELQQEHGCPVLHAGDLFHHWKPSPFLISLTIQYLPDKFYTVAGNHDLPQHNLDLIEMSGLNAIRVAGRLKWFANSGNFGQDPGVAFRTTGPERNVGVLHQFVWDGVKLPWPGCEEMTARQVLKKYPTYDLIVTGDHHKPFTAAYKDRLLVNCGCFTRQTADYANHRPRVWLWYNETNTVEPYYLTIEKGVVTREHLEGKESRDKRIEAFISKLSDSGEMGLSFEDNLKRFINSNKLSTPVVDLIYKALEEKEL